jgi:cell volume regulation protein A
MELILLFLIIGGIIFLGWLAEMIFSKTGIPDVLLLILVGVLIGAGLHLVAPDAFASVAPYFITFALIFMAFNGALSFDIREVSTHFPKIGRAHV